MELIIWAVIGTLSGMVFGMIPGAGPFIATAMFFPFLQGESPNSIMMYYVSVLVATNYTNSVTAILYGIPGDAAAIVTARTGHRFFRKGMGSLAVSSNAISSTIGVAFAVFIFIILLPNIIDIFKFYNSIIQVLLISCAILLITFFTKQNKIITILLFFTGGILAHIGMNPVTYKSWGTFGIPHLSLGIPFSVVMITLYLIPEILRMGDGNSIAEPKKINRFAVGKNTILPSLVGSFIGFWSGMIPGITNILGSYASAQIILKFFKKPYLKSIAAAEAANNSGALSSLLPLLVLAIPITGSEVLIYYLMVASGFEFNIENTINQLHSILYLIPIVSLICLYVSWNGFNILSSVAYFYKKNHHVINIIILAMICAVSIYISYHPWYTVILLLLTLPLGLLVRRFDTSPIIYGFFLSDLFYENLVRTLIILN